MVDKKLYAMFLFMFTITLRPASNLQQHILRSIHLCCAKFANFVFCLANDSLPLRYYYPVKFTFPRLVINRMTHNMSFMSPRIAFIMPFLTLVKEYMRKKMTLCCVTETFGICWTAVRKQF